MKPIASLSSFVSLLPAFVKSRLRNSTRSPYQTPVNFTNRAFIKEQIQYVDSQFYIYKVSVTDKDSAAIRINFIEWAEIF